LYELDHDRLYICAVKFIIEIVHDRKRYQLQVKQISVTASHEQYEVNYNGKIVTLQNNWPVFKRHHLKHRRPTWTIVSGEIKYRSIREQVIKALEDKLIALQ